MTEHRREYQRKWREKNRELYRSYSRKWLQNPDNKKKHRECNISHKLRRRYGITINERDELLSRNSGLCEICNDTPSSCIDHNHATNNIRGALCHNCNKAIGLMRDSTYILECAIRYLNQ